MDKIYFEEMKQKVDELHKKMKDEGKQFFSDQSRILFAENPILLKFGWVQYTPYYNDGDTCEFSAQLEYPRMLLVGQEEEVYQEESWFPSDAEITDEVITWRNITKFLSQFDDEDVELLFGDHCEVVVTRDGVEVEEYEHD